MSPVTVADREAEQLLRARIAERFPDDGIVGEEFGIQTGTTSYQWVFDPIDGTKSFIHGVPLYTTLVALLRDNEPVVGVIHAPAVGETVYAAKGGGCWQLRASDQSPLPAHVSKVAELSDTSVMTTSPSPWDTQRQSVAALPVARGAYPARASAWFNTVRIAVSSSAIRMVPPGMPFSLLNAAATADPAAAGARETPCAWEPTRIR
jgi:fructose-1,6-bisphosphatase/inositol monophosphatase family enzyme